MKYDPFNIYGWYCYDPDRVRKRYRYKSNTSVVRWVLQTNAK